MSAWIWWTIAVFILILIFLLFAFLLSNFFYSKSKKRFLRRVFNQNNHSILIGGKDGNGKKNLGFFIMKEYSKHWNRLATYPKPENKNKLVNVYSNLDKSAFKGMKLEYHKIDSSNWDSSGSTFKNNSFIIIDDLHNTLKQFKLEEKYKTNLKSKAALKNQTEVTEKVIDFSYVTNNFKKNNQKLIVMEQNWFSLKEDVLNNFNFYAYIWESQLKTNKKRLILNIKGTDFLEAYTRKVQRNPKVFLKQKSFKTTENYEVNIKNI